jgi:hypothetical protein
VSESTTEAPAKQAAISRRVREALSKEGVKAADLTEDQRDRALHPERKDGLRGKDLASWVIGGDEGLKADRETRSRQSAADDKAKSKGERKKSTRYEEWVPEAVERGRKLSGQKPKADGSGPEGDETLAYAGPIQHIKIRTVIGKKLGAKVSPGGTVTGGDVTPEAILKLAGGSGENAKPMSFKELKDIATFKADKGAMRPLRELGQEFGSDGWAKGRYLAAALVVWIEDLKAA